MNPVDIKMENKTRGFEQVINFFLACGPIGPDFSCAFYDIYYFSYFSPQIFFPTFSTRIQTRVKVTVKMS